MIQHPLRGRVFAAIPAAGAGRRMGLGYSKSYATLADVPLLARTLRALLACPQLDHLWVAVRPEELDLCRRQVLEPYLLAEAVTLVAGGEERQDSVERLLEALPPDRDLVLVHDGARPFVTPELVARVLLAADRNGAALAALPSTDTVKLTADGETVKETLEREGVWLAQTPQAFHRDLLIGAYRTARREGHRGTDDASLVEAAGGSVTLVRGERGNLKVTTPEDMEFAEWVLHGGKR